MQGIKSRLKRAEAAIKAIYEPPQLPPILVQDGMMWYIQNGEDIKSFNSEQAALDYIKENYANYDNYLYIILEE